MVAAWWIGYRDRSPRQWSLDDFTIISRLVSCAAAAAEEKCLEGECIRRRSSMM